MATESNGSQITYRNFLYMVAGFVSFAAVAVGAYVSSVASSLSIQIEDNKIDVIEKVEVESKVLRAIIKDHKEQDVHRGAFTKAEYDRHLVPRLIAHERFDAQMREDLSEIKKLILSITKPYDRQQGSVIGPPMNSLRQKSMQ